MKISSPRARGRLRIHGDLSVVRLTFRTLFIGLSFCFALFILYNLGGCTTQYPKPGSVPGGTQHISWEEACSTQGGVVWCERTGIDSKDCQCVSQEMARRALSGVFRY